ncbi:MAG TPA: PadR family transcriptional regulator [Pseudonocardiaceae bacterium]|jgi:DNA-binding PadR family transcriptional regulator|nr:PadR family transcriptional regulator [Pseudonocardiaceae bacterium]
MSSRNSLTPLALAALEILHEGPRHPYEIHQTLRDRQTSRLVKLSAGTLYHTIERLDRDELIEVVETSRAGRRPERTTYRLTSAGRDAFAERLRGMLCTVADEYPQFDLAVELMHALSQEDALSQLRTRVIALESTIAAQRVWVERITEQGLHPLYWPDVKLRLAMLEAEFTWVSELIGQLDRGEVRWPAGKGAGCAAGATELRLVSDEQGNDHHSGAETAQQR